MGELVQRGGRLVLVVAARGQRRQLRVVDVAVGDDVLGGQSPGQDVGLAVSEGILAVVGGATAGGGAGLLGHSLQTLNDGAAGLGIGGHEVLLEAGVVAGLSGGGGLGGQVGGVLEGSLQGGLLFSGALGHLRTLDDVLGGVGDLGSLSTVDGDGQLVGGVGDGANDSAVLRGGDAAGRADGDGATLGEIAGAGDVELILDDGTGGQGGEGILGQALGPEALLDSLEGNLGG